MPLCPTDTNVFNAGGTKHQFVLLVLPGQFGHSNLSPLTLCYQLKLFDRKQICKVIDFSINTITQRSGFVPTTEEKSS